MGDGQGEGRYTVNETREYNCIGPEMRSTALSIQAKKRIVEIRVNGSFST